MTAFLPLPNHNPLPCHFYHHLHRQEEKAVRSRRENGQCTGGVELKDGQRRASGVQGQEERGNLGYMTKVPGVLEARSSRLFKYTNVA
jgi:hypothetical protein